MPDPKEIISDAAVVAGKASKLTFKSEKYAQLKCSKMGPLSKASAASRHDTVLSAIKASLSVYQKSQKRDADALIKTSTMLCEADEFLSRDMEKSGG
jgi:hypothetical protein